MTNRLTPIVIGLCIFLFCFMTPMRSFGQSIDRMVVATAGEDFHTSEGSLVFTLGELNIETLISDIQLSQGFHQEWVVITSVTPASVEVLDVNVFPNPTSGILNIESETDLQILLYDLSGKLKLRTSQPSGSGQIQIGDFPSGGYVLHASDNIGKMKVFKIQKLD